MGYYETLSARLESWTQKLSGHPRMQGKIGKALLAIPPTPGNALTLIIIAIGLLITLVRFTGGIGAVTNLDDNYPWGLWIAFDLLCGVALAAGGYVTSAACLLFGMKRYASAVRPAITTAFLGYFFVVVALLYDVGQPWRLHYSLLVSPGTTSLLFEVGLCVGLYLTVLFIEWLPALLEWLLSKPACPRLVRLRPRLFTLRKGILYATIPLTILGVVFSTMHQSSLGALFLIAPGKMHPLWYSPFIPVLFFFSSIAAGLSMVIFESSLSHKVLHDKMDERHLAQNEGVLLGFGRAASFVLMGYFVIKMLDVAMDDEWALLGTGYGLWFLVEVLGFVLLPAFVYAMGVRERRTELIQRASMLTVLGIVVNRFNVCLVAFNWNLPPEQKYFPSLSEILLSVFIVTLIVTAYRFITSRMPVLHQHPDYKDAH